MVVRSLFQIGFKVSQAYTSSLHIKSCMLLADESLPPFKDRHLSCLWLKAVLNIKQCDSQVIDGLTIKFNSILYKLN